MCSTVSRLGIAIVAVTTIAVVLRPGLGAAEAKEGAAAQSTAAPTGEAKALIDKIQNYRSWPKFSEYANGPKQSRGHGGAFVVAHYNDVAGQAVKSGAASFPNGSIIVKENRPQPDAAPAALTSMAKANGTWYWLKSTTSGQVFTSNGKPVAGQVAACAGCHAGATKDMVFSK